MFKIHVTFFLISFLSFSTPALAAGKSSAHKHLKGQTLREVFSDTMMVGEYRTQRGDTNTFNYTEYHFKNGTSDYKEGALHDTGLWNIVGKDKICYKYPKSKTYTRTYCFFVYEANGCYYKYSVYNMGLNGPRSWDAWSSRAIRKGSGGSCAAPAS